MIEITKFVGSTLVSYAKFHNINSFNIPLIEQHEVHAYKRNIYTRIFNFSLDDTNCQLDYDMSQLRLSCSAANLFEYQDKSLNIIGSTGSRAITYIHKILTLSGAREEDRNVENLLLIQPVPNP